MEFMDYVDEIDDGRRATEWRSDGATRVAYTKRSEWHKYVLANACVSLRVCVCNECLNVWHSLRGKINFVLAKSREKIVNIFCTKYFWHFQTIRVVFISLFVSFLFEREKIAHLHLHSVTYIRLYLMALFSRRVFPFSPTLENATPYTTLKMYVQFERIVTEVRDE